MGVCLIKEDQVHRADVQFRKTKADQQAFGCTRTQYAVDHRSRTEVCVVTALRMLKAWAPCRFQGAEAHLPLFRTAKGELLTREKVQGVLQDAAAAVGLPHSRFKTHSLLIGGASAMLHATQQFDLVKRFGRWSSDAVHIYLHDSAQQVRDLASAMARNKSSVHYT